MKWEIGIAMVFSSLLAPVALAQDSCQDLSVQLAGLNSQLSQATQAFEAARDSSKAATLQSSAHEQSRQDEVDNLKRMSQLQQQIDALQIQKRSQCKG